MSNTAFIGDIGASQRIVSCYHHDPYFSSFQLFNGSFGFGLQFVLEYLETIEK